VTRNGPPSTPVVVLAVGPVLVALTVAASLVGGATAWSPSVPSWALAVALVALVLGVPHGAVDHLTLVGSSGTRTGALGRLLYVGTAAVAALLVMLVPGPAFVVVLGMSVWHFGSGDVEAAADLSGRARRPRAARVVLALALGSAPVLLPLTGPSAVSTLRLIHPQLAVVLTPVVMSVTRYAVLCVIALAVTLLVRSGDRRGAGELVLLSVLGVVASPLVAFAVYFASWHALRHTARLAADPVGIVRPAALARTFAAGLPALVVTIVVAAVCVLGFRGHAVLSTWLWVGLALVWGLTVPHMVVVARFDRDRQVRSTFSIGRPLASSSTSLSR